MNLPKNIIIGGITTAVVIIGAGAYLAHDNSSGQNTSGKALLEDYKELLEEVQDSKTKTNLSKNCDNPQKYSDQIQDLETKLDLLRQRKNDLINTENSEQDEWIPPIPGSEVPDLDPMPSSEGNSGDDYQEWIPPIPGSEVPDFDPAPNNEVNPLGDGEEWIPPIPGSEVPDLDPTPSSEGNSGDDYQEWIPPIPGSVPLDLDPSPKEFTIDEINEIEEKINAELDNLKTLCSEEAEKEIVSTSCPDACRKYSDCAGYADDATAENLKEAYESCMIECANWSDKTKICINKKPIKAPIDCTNMTLCALPEYGGYGSE